MRVPGNDNADSGRGTSRLTRGEGIALLFFFILGILYIAWHLYNRNKVAVDIGEDIGTVTVAVSGEVRSPGTYTLPMGSKVLDAVAAAGGYTSSADVEAIEVDNFLGDGDAIEVPGILRSFPQDGGSGDDGRSGPGGPININQADLETLMELPGIGETTATKIIEYRMLVGPFIRLEDIMNVEGIGEGKFEEIRMLITVL